MVLTALFPSGKEEATRFLAKNFPLGSNTSFVSHHRKGKLLSLSVRTNKSGPKPANKFFGMAAAAEGAGPTTKAIVSDSAATPQNQPKPSGTLEEDDEFEDFPVDGIQIFSYTTLVGSVADGHIDWGTEDQEVPGESSAHMWEESWDDDDTNEDFSKQLKYVRS